MERRIEAASGGVSNSVHDSPLSVAVSAKSSVIAQSKRGGPPRPCRRGWLAAVDAGRRACGRPPGVREGRSGCGLEAAVRFEDGVPNRLLRVYVPIRGTQQREAPALSVDGVLPGRERDVAPSRTPFPDGEADELEPVQRAGVGFEDHFRVGELPWGIARSVRKDPVQTSPVPSAWTWVLL